MSLPSSDSVPSFSSSELSRSIQQCWYTGFSFAGYPVDLSQLNIPRVAASEADWENHFESYLLEEVPSCFCMGKLASSKPMKDVPGSSRASPLARFQIHALYSNI